MPTTLRPTQMAQLQSFWNLIQTVDEGVQRELFVLLKHKYSESRMDVEEEAPSFLQMQGILKGGGSQEKDRQMLDEYFKEKYGV